MFRACRLAVVSLLGLLLAALLFAPGPDPARSPDQRPSSAVARRGGLPLHFEPLTATTDEFVALGHGYRLRLTADQSLLQLAAGERRATLSIALAGAAPDAAATLLEPQRGVSNYFVGDDPARWRTAVPHYGRVAFDDVYPGIDVVYYGNDEGRLEHDFALAPGANPEQIRMVVAGATAAALDREGNLRLAADGGEMVLRRPVAYQDRDGVREPVDAAYHLSRDHEVRIALGPYDPARELVIDPVLEYGTFLGGSGDDRGKDIALDAAGNIYVLGETGSMDFPTTAGSYHNTPFGSGSGDLFVLKFNPDWQLAYSTYFGGYDNETAGGLAVDAAGNVYLTGSTNSLDLPTTAGALQTTHAVDYGYADGFVTKLDPSGSALIYSTYLGGSGYDHGAALAIDGAGHAYVAGDTDSGDFPTTLGAYLGAPVEDTQGFVAKLSPAGASLLYCTCLGGDDWDEIAAVAVDTAGQAYVTGLTYSTDFPTTAGALQAAPGGNLDAFVTKLSSTGAALSYSTYLSGSQSEQGQAIAVDAAGQAYVAGYTGSDDFPVTPGAFQTTRAASNDGFVSLLTAGGALSWSTLVGGDDSDSVEDLALDSLGNVYAGGATWSTDYPTVAGAPQSLSQGTGDGFVTIFPAGGGMPSCSTYVGGYDQDIVYGIAAAGPTRAYLTGKTQSYDFPITNDAAQSYPGGSQDAFVALLDLTRTTVTEQADAGPGSLREAIAWANAQPGAQPLTIDFDLYSGYGFQTYGRTEGLGGTTVISLDTALPTLSRANVTIDGATQTGYAGQPLVYLTPADGPLTLLSTNAANTTVQALGFHGEGSLGVHCQPGGAGAKVYGCWFGFDGLGAPQPLATAVLVEPHLCQIGGTGANQWCRFGSASDTAVKLFGNQNAVLGNLFGSAPDMSPAPNGAGIAITGSQNVVGGTLAEGNTIGHATGPAVSVSDGGRQNRIQGNSIHGNGTGILLVGNANDALPPPILDLVTNDAGTGQVSWHWAGSAAGPYRIEFYATARGGTPQGDQQIGMANPSTLGGQQTTVLSRPLTTSEELTATITDGAGNTSPFSVPMLLAEKLVIVQQPGSGAVRANLPAMVVAIQNAEGTTLPNAAADITVALETNPPGAVLSGTTTRRALAGLATFDNLQLDKIGSGFSLKALAPPLLAAVSNTFDTVAGPSSPARTTATVPGGTVGQPTNLTVQTFDADGNPRLIGGDLVVIGVSGPNNATPVVTDHGDGTYTASYVPTATGTDQVAVALNGTAIANSPFASAVAPGPTDPSRSTASTTDGVAGAPTTIRVVARDGFGNPRNVGGDAVAVQISGANPQAPAVTDLGDGRYNATYTPTVVGTDTIAVTIGGSPVADSPLLSRVAPGPTDPAHCSATVPHGEVGQPTVCSIIARDAQNNRRTSGGDTVVVNISGSNSGSATVTDHGDGSYTARYTPANRGTDQLAILIGGAPIGGSPFTSQVAGLVTAPERSTATVPAQGTVGSTTVIVVQARDQDGQPRTSGGDTVVVDVTGANTARPAVTDRGDGTYVAQYRPGNLGADSVAITINGTAIQGSPYASQVLPGATDPATTTATVPHGVAGQPTNLLVQARDQFGNPRGGGGDVVTVVVTGANAASPTAVDAGDGTYRASYTPQAAGTDRIAITINGSPIQGSPYPSAVTPAGVDQARSSLTATPAAAMADGAETIVLNLFLRDGYGNPVSGVPVADVTVTVAASPLSGDGVAILGPRLPSDAAGQMTIPVRATRPQPLTMRVACRGAVWQADVVFTRRPIAPDRCEVRLDPSLIAADGSERAVLQVTLRAADGTPVEGFAPADRTVALTGPVAAQVAAADDGRTTGQDGRYEVALTASAAGDTRVQASADGQALAAVALHSREFLDIVLPAGVTLAALPLTPEPASLAAFLAIPGVQAAIWNPLTQSYAPLTWSASRQVSPVGPGDAVWLRCQNPVNFRLFGTYAEPVTQRIGLAQGWNTIGNPFRASLPWDLSRIRVEVNGVDVGSLGTEALWATTIRPYGWAYLPALQSGYTLIYDPAKPGFSQARGDVPAFAGLWVRALQPGVTLVLPPPSGASRGRLVRAVGPRDWSARLTATLQGEADTDNLFGASSGLTRALPIATPPLPASGEAPLVDLAFLDDLSGERLAGLLQPGSSRSDTWQAEVTSRAAGEVTLTWPGLLRELPRGVIVELTDLTNGQTVLLNTHAAYRYATLAGEPRRFTVAARYGRVERSQITALSAAPTRGAGVALSLTTSGPAEVTVTVRGLSGRLVKQFGQTVEAGTTTLAWDGTDASGRRVPQGTYQVEAVAVSANGAMSRAVRTVVVN